MKKGFTLVELISVISLVALVFLLVIPGISNLINNKKDDISSTMNEVLYNAAGLYISNDNIYPLTNGNIYCIKLDTLIDKEYLSNPIIDPITQNEISKDKFVKISVKDNKYDYSIEAECSEVRFGEGSDLFVMITANEAYEASDYGWYNSDLFVDIEGNGSSYKWCSTTEGDTCNPSVEVLSNSGSTYIDTEGVNAVCAKAINENAESEIVCQNFNLDKTAPVINFLAVTDDNIDEEIFNIPFTLEDSVSGVNKAEKVDYDNNSTQLTIDSTTNTYNTNFDFEIKFTDNGIDSYSFFYVIGYDMAGNSTKYSATIYKNMISSYGALEDQSSHATVAKYVYTDVYDLSINRDQGNYACKMYGYSASTEYEIANNKIQFTLSPNCDDVIRESAKVCYDDIYDKYEGGYGDECETVTSSPLACGTGPTYDVNKCYYCEYGYNSWLDDYSGIIPEYTCYKGNYTYFYNISWYDYSITKYW